MHDEPVHPLAPGGTLLVLAKEPLPGRVKTRLTSRFSPEDAARLAEASLHDTLDVVAETPAARRVLVLDGRPGPWLPPGMEVVPQVGGGLDLRLAAAFDGVEGPTLLVGMDTPQLTPDLLRSGLDLLAEGADAVLGPATDGGYWAIGMRRPDTAAFPGVPMSVDETGREQLRRLLALGLDVTLLPELRDVDQPDDVALVAAEVPHGRFALTAAACASASDVA
ncbi:MAG: TIGR04282 family arsenosugar biosynthesis glycosyltransferase [Actinomycetota bacterium]